MFNLSSSILLASLNPKDLLVLEVAHISIFIMSTITYCLKLIYKRPLKKIESSELRFFSNHHIQHITKLSLFNLILIDKRTR